MSTPGRRLNLGASDGIVYAVVYAVDPTVDAWRLLGVKKKDAALAFFPKTDGRTPQV